MVEFLVVLVKLVHGAHGAAQFLEIIREDPRIGVALAVLLLAGAAFALLSRKTRRIEPLTIRTRD